MAVGTSFENQDLIPKSSDPSRVELQSTAPDQPTKSDHTLFGLLWNSFFDCLALIGAALGWQRSTSNYSYSKIQSVTDESDPQLELDDLEAYHDDDLDDFDSASISCIEEGRAPVDSDYRVYDAKPFNAPGATRAREDVIL